MNSSINNAMDRTTTGCAAFLYRLFISLAFLAASTGAMAASSERGRVIEEIIVTAEKRAESVLDVPLTLSAFDETLVTELGITNESDLEVLVPGLQFGDYGESVGQGTVIRGIGSRLAGETHSDLAVATYIDGVYTLGTYGVAPSFFDLERVEVARGPQGTLHGRNSIAGSISYYTKKPTDEWDLVALVEYTDQFTQRYNVAGGGAITDSLWFRISGGYYEGDGAQKNRGLGDDYDAPDQISYSPQLRFKTERLDVNFRWAHSEDKGAPRTQIMATNPDRTSETINGAFNPFYLDPTPNPSVPSYCPPEVPGIVCGNLKNELAVNTTGIQDSEADQYFLSAELNITDALTLRYNYGDGDVRREASRDRDSSNRIPDPNDLSRAIDADVRFENRRVGVIYEYTETSHELQLTSDFDGRFNFITGFFYYENDTTWSVPRDNFSSTFRFTDTDAAARAVEPPEDEAPYTDCQNYLTRIMSGLTCAPGADHTRDLLFLTNGTSETQAVFANADLRISDQWLVSGGLRHTEDEKNQGFNGGWLVFASGGVVPVFFFFDDTDERTRTWSRTIGHVSLEYTPRDGLLLYGRLSTGYRAGGFNTFAPDSPGDIIEEETLINYELGIKGLFLEQRLQLSAAVFFNDYDGLQLNAIQIRPVGSPVPPQTPTPLVEYTSNIPDSELWGGEVEFVYQPNDNWRFSGYYQYLDSKIGEHRSVIRANPDAVFLDYEHQNEDGVTIMTPYETATDQTGNKLPQQPTHKLSFTAIYEQPIAVGDMQLLTTYSYTGDRHADIGNLSVHEIPAYGRWDVRATWNLPEKNLSTTFYVQNLLDEIGVIEYIPISTNSAVRSATTMTNHRQIGLQVIYRLNN